MKQIALILVPALALSACSDLSLMETPPWKRSKTPQADVEISSADNFPAADAVEVSELPSGAEAATPKPAASGMLGTTVASLGDPSRDGFWIETPLVSSPAKGKVRYPKNGREVVVDLIPIDGPATAGSRLSLGLMRLLDAPITGLPEVEVYIEA